MGNNILDAQAKQGFEIQQARGLLPRVLFHELETEVSEQKFDIWGDNLNEFLDQLTQLTIRHHIGMNDEGILYEMEHDDFDRTFCVTNDGRLEFV